MKRRTTLGGAPLVLRPLPPRLPRVRLRTGRVLLFHPPAPQDIPTYKVEKRLGIVLCVGGLATDPRAIKAYYPSYSHVHGRKGETCFINRNALIAGSWGSGDGKGTGISCEVSDACGWARSTSVVRMCSSKWCCVSWLIWMLPYPI